MKWPVVHIVWAQYSHASNQASNIVLSQVFWPVPLPNIVQAHHHLLPELFSLHPLKHANCKAKLSFETSLLIDSLIYLREHSQKMSFDNHLNKFAQNLAFLIGPLLLLWRIYFIANHIYVFLNHKTFRPQEEEPYCFQKQRVNSNFTQQTSE